MKQHVREIVVTTAFIAAVWACLEMFFRYWFFNIEQQQLFIFSGDYCMELLSGHGTLPLRPGGATVLLSRFVVQFFRVPFVGAAVTTLIIFLSGLSLRGVMRRMDVNVALSPLCFLPMLAASLSVLDSPFLYEGLFALFFAILMLNVYVVFSSENTMKRAVFGALLAVFLYALAGSVAVLFGVSALLLDILVAGRKRLLSAIIPCVAIALGGFFYIAGMYGEFRLSVLSDMYYDYAADMPWWHYFSWVLLLLVVVVFRFVRCKNISLRLSAVVSVALVLAEIGGFIAVYFLLNDKVFMRVAQFERYADRGDWDAIIKCCGDGVDSYFEGNYLNMALAEKDSLLERMFSYDQQGPFSIAVDADWAKESPTVLAHVHYASLNVVQSMSMAFNAYSTALSGGNPSMLKLLVKNNLIIGAYDVARKYIDMLSKTLFYKDWAERMRSYLGNDEAVRGDAELGRRRRALPKTDSLMINMMDVRNLEMIVSANPTDRRARDYMIALMLLAKDMDGVKAFVERYYGTEVLPELPEVLQEAVVYYSPDLDYCAQYGVDSDVARRYYDMNLAANSGSESPESPSEEAMRPYKNTLWYYLFFVNF